MKTKLLAISLLLSPLASAQGIADAPGGALTSLAPGDLFRVDDVSAAAGSISKHIDSTNLLAELLNLGNTMSLGDGTGATVVITGNVSGTDTTLTFGNGTVGFSHALTVGGAISGSNLSGTNTGDQTAGGPLTVVTTAFGGNFADDASHDTVQELMDVIDDLPLGSFDSTAVDATTWSDGANGSNIWTFDVSGTDTTFTAGNGTAGFSHDVTVGGDLTVTGDITDSGVAVPTISSTSTLTNKRVTPRVETLTDAATVTPASDSYDGGKLTTLSQATEIANPTGTPTEFQRYTLRIESSTSRALTWGSQFRFSTDLPDPAATTGGGSTDYLAFIWNATDSKWDCVAKNFGF